MLVEAAREPPSVLQIWIDLYRQPRPSLLRFAARHGIALQAFNPLGYQWGKEGPEPSSVRNAQGLLTRRLERVRIWLHSLSVPASSVRISQESAPWSIGDS